MPVSELALRSCKLFSDVPPEVLEQASQQMEIVQLRRREADDEAAALCRHLDDTLAGIDAAFAKADVLVSPTAPTTAFKLGEKLEDPLAMYLNDIATIPVNLAGNSAMSVPIGLAPEDNLPVCLQIIAPAMRDDLLENGDYAVILNRDNREIQ